MIIIAFTNCPFFNAFSVTPKFWLWLKFITRLHSHHFTCPIFRKTSWWIRTGESTSPISLCASLSLPIQKSRTPESSKKKTWTEHIIVLKCFLKNIFNLYVCFLSSSPSHLSNLSHLHLFLMKKTSPATYPSLPERFGDFPRYAFCLGDSAVWKESSPHFLLPTTTNWPKETQRNGGLFTAPIKWRYIRYCFQVGCFFSGEAC